MKVAEAADHILGSAHLQYVSADFVCALPYLVNHGGSGDAIGEELVGVEVHLVLAHKAADAGHLCHAGHGFKLIAQIPVLQRAQIRQALGVTAIDDGILIDPARAGCIGTDSRMNIRGQPPGNLLQVLRHARSRPVEICVVLKHDEDIRVAEHGLSTHVLHARSRKQGGHDRVGNLVFNHIRGLASPLRVNDHLHVADVGQCVQRRSLHAPITRHNQENGPGEYQKRVACAPRDDP